MRTFKPFIVCFKCKGNIIDCHCNWEPSSPAWVSQLRRRYAAKVLRGEPGMKFVFNDETYGIDFVREHKVIRRDVVDGVEVEVKSKYPSTTVNILKLDPTSKDAKGRLTTKNSTVFATATVGAWHKEPVFSLEKGRLRALRNVVRTLPKEMKPLVFDAYFSRTIKAQKPAETPKPETPKAPEPMVVS